MKMVKVISTGFVLVVITLTSLFLSHSQASAHSELISSNPSPGQVFETSPEEIVLTFNTPVEIFPSSIRVYDENAQRVNQNNLPTTDENSVHLQLQDLDAGRYIVTWNVISADTHPIRGAFSFIVENSAQDPVEEPSKDEDDSAVIDEILESQKISNISRIFTFIFSALVFLSLSVLVAISFVFIGILKTTPDKKVNRLVFLSALICIVASVLGIIHYSSVTQDVSFIQALSIDSISNQISTMYSIVGLIRILLCVLIIAFWKKVNEQLGKYVVIASAFLLAFTPAFSGHARVGDLVVIAIVMSAIHVLAVSIWIGGLISIATKIKDLALETVKTFSNISLYCVLAITASGVFAIWRQAGSINAIRTTWYGQVFSIKLLLFIIVICIAIFSRFYVSALIKKDSFNLRAQIRKFVIVELILILGIYGATSVLVNTIPAKQAYAQPVTISSSVQGATFEFIIDPPENDQTEIHIYILDNNSLPMQLDTYIRSLEQDTLMVTLSNEDLGVQSRQVQMRFLGLNHFSAFVELQREGTWTIDAQLHLDKKLETSVEAQF